MGNLLKIPGYVIVLGGNIWGFFLSVGLLQNWIGDVLGIILGLFIFPVLLAAAPIIEGFAHSNWTPLLVIYGSLFIGGSMVLLGAKIDGE
jgi:hypothetical protein